MSSESDKVKRKLKSAGISGTAIAAAWPAWWSNEAEASSSARAELRFTLARNLGLSPNGLLQDEVRFVWRDEARFKHLTDEGETQKAALASFGCALGRLLIQATPRADKEPADAAALRAAILSGSEYVDLYSLISACWAFGIPVIHLRVFPLPAKRMHAMVVKVGERSAILLGRDAGYPSPVAFSLAHEMGHVACGHIADSAALVEVGDPAKATSKDGEELEADNYALTLLTGRPDPIIETSLQDFNAPTLAAAVMEAGPALHIEPGALALCHAYQTKTWARGSAALRFIYRERAPVWLAVNRAAASQIDWTSIGEEASKYLGRVMGALDA